MKSEEHTHKPNEILIATVIKNSVRQICKRLYTNVYRDEIEKYVMATYKKKRKLKKIAVLENAVISNVFAQKNIMKCFVHRKDFEGFNVAAISLQNSTITKHTAKKIIDFIAFSNIDVEDDLTDMEKDSIQENYAQRSFRICYRNENLKVKRLSYKNPEFYTPAVLGRYPATRYSCAERKILGTILGKFKEFQRHHPEYKNEKLGGTLYLYTKMEPCFYCMNAIDEFIKETNTKVYIVYEELLFEMTRDRLFAGHKGYSKLDLIAPTPYRTLELYDKELAESFCEEIKDRKGINIAGRWQPFIDY
ncbi:hypothetical protein [Bacillus cereus group sp. MYBK194-1]|uniref:hypothetical protein n=1 Tax=unclassified Bacillus cereus group TaxID=2750818 RepID=UPI003F79D0B9